MTDNDGHTLKDPRDLLIEALRAEREALAEMATMGLSFPDAARPERDALRRATEAAERALAEAPLPTEEQALTTINDRIGGGFGVTIRSDELKGYTPDDEGSNVKTYLDAADCRALAEAFAYFAARFATVRP